MDADHRLVVAKVRINKPKENKGKGARRYKVDKLKEQAIVEELQQNIQTNLQEHVQEDEEDVESMWNGFIDVALKAAEEVLEEKSPYRGNM